MSPRAQLVILYFALYAFLFIVPFVVRDMYVLPSGVINNYNNNKNLCGRDGRTICGPQCVPKSTSVTLAVDEKTLPMATVTGRTDRQTDRQSATQYAAPS